MGRDMKDALSKMGKIIKKKGPRGIKGHTNLGAEHSEQHAGRSKYQVGDSKR
jgi:hypothetical protein